MMLVCDSGSGDLMFSLCWLSLLILVNGITINAAYYMVVSERRIAAVRARERVSSRRLRVTRKRGYQRYRSLWRTSRRRLDSSGEV